jgi:ADP-heptose:LPS heptosyltransferase
MTHLIGALGLATGICYPQFMLSPDDLAAGLKRVAAILGESVGQVVGIFVGGRKARGKRWAKERFLKLAVSLHAGGARVIVFIGPDERALAAYFQGELGRRAAVVFEPDLRRFASLIASCHLFVACDSGPVHLACALRVRTVVIFYITIPIAGARRLTSRESSTRMAVCQSTPFSTSAVRSYCGSLRSN